MKTQHFNSLGFYVNISQYVNFDIKFAKICKKVRDKWVISPVLEQKRSGNELAVKNRPLHTVFFQVIDC